MAKRPTGNQQTNADDIADAVVDVSERMTFGPFERLLMIAILTVLGFGVGGQYRGGAPTETVAVAKVVAEAVAQAMSEPVKDHERRITTIEANGYTREKAVADMEKMEKRINEGVAKEFRAVVSELRQELRKDIREELSAR